MSYKTITVILGAGASWDAQISSFGPPKSGCRIPLTNELFNVAWPSLGGEDPKIVYPGAANIGHLYFSKVKKGEKISLETFLNDMLSQKQSDKSYHRIVMNIRQLIFYMRRLIGDLGAQIREVDRHTAFHNLVNHLCNGTYEKVVFLTTNYDLLLEWALEDSLHMRFTGMNSYLEHDDKWSLVKFHGSVSWVREVGVNVYPQFDKDRIAESITGFNANSLEFDKLPIKINTKNYGHQWTEKACLHPVMVLPHALGKRCVCPDDHIKAIVPHLNECEDVWIIGNSFMDEDLVSFIRKEARHVKRVKLVDKEYQGQDSLNDKYALAKRIEECFLSAQIESYNEGFGNFALKYLS